MQDFFDDRAPGNLPPARVFRIKIALTANGTLLDRRAAPPTGRSIPD